jgi:hypothetical protein
VTPPEGHVRWRDGRAEGGRRRDEGVWGWVDVHHTATPGDRPLAESMRSMWEWHTRSRTASPPGRGAADILYHVVVAPDGSWAVGRPWDRWAGRADGLQVAFLGDLSRDRPSPAARATMHCLLRDAVRRGVAAPRVRGHRERAATECPGRGGMAWVRVVRARERWI